jgi:general secretion pathway protein N
MKRPRHFLWLLVALGVGAFVIFALVTFPANVVLSRLGSAGIVASGVSGSIWNGRAQALQVQGTNIGSVEWRLHFLPLLMARAQANVKITRTDGFATTHVTVRPGGSISLKALTASLPLSALPPNVVPGGWVGTLNAKFAQLTLDKGWPTHVDGSIDVVDVTGPARKPAKMGSYRLVFDPAASTAEKLQGSLSDTGDGPLQVTGTLQLKSDRSYAVDALVAARPDAPRSVTSALEFLPPPDAQGRRPFGAEGTI